MGFDVITIGSATQDLFLNVDFLRQKQKVLCLDAGKKFEVGKPLLETGGGATNAAVGFSRLGLKTAVIAKVGRDDAGHLIKRRLQLEKVDTRWVFEHATIGTAIAFILMKRGMDRTVLVYRGAAEELAMRDVKVNDVKSKWLYVSALAGKSIGVLKPLLQHARQRGMMVACNPGAQELHMSSLLKFVDVLLVNKEEAEQLAKTRGSEKNMLEKLASFGPQTIAMTNGAKAIFVYYHGVIYRARPFDVKIETTLGAGDAFASGFVAALVKGKSIVEAMGWGCLNAASVIQHVGAKVNLLRENELERFERSLKQGFEVARV